MFLEGRGSVGSYSACIGRTACLGKWFAWETGGRWKLWHILQSNLFFTIMVTMISKNK